MCSLGGEPQSKVSFKLLGALKRLTLGKNNKGKVIRKTDQFVNFYIRHVSSESEVGIKSKNNLVKMSSPSFTGKP